MRRPAGPEQPARAGGTRGARRRLAAAAPASGCSGGRCSPRGPLARATDPRVAIAHQAAAASDSRVRAPAGPVRRPSGRPEPHSGRRSPLLQQRPELTPRGPLVRGTRACGGSQHRPRVRCASGGPACTHALRRPRPRAVDAGARGAGLETSGGCCLRRKWRLE